jgi:hypothetical protein
MGPIVIVVGVLLIVFGIQNERRAEERRTQQSREFMDGRRDIHDIDNGPSAGFFMISGGMFAIVIGLGLLGFAFQKAMLRYQMRQYAPVVKEAIREGAPALAFSGTRACPSCQSDCPIDAKFCKQCGAVFTVVPALETKALARREAVRVNANVVDGRLALDQFRAELLQTVGRAEVAFELRRVVAEVFRLVARRDRQVQGAGAVALGANVAAAGDFAGRLASLCCSGHGRLLCGDEVQVNKVNYLYFPREFNRENEKNIEKTRKSL